ncbi:hypothetical protein ACHQM5_003093 [Ranunculus cassubicifolius]
MFSYLHRKSINPTFSRALNHYRHCHKSLLSFEDLLGTSDDPKPEISPPQSHNHHQSNDDSSHKLNALISSCAKSCSLSLGEQAHATTIKLGQSSNVFIGTSLVDLYSKCYNIISAYQMFVEMPERNVVTWNSLISGCLLARLSQHAFDLFKIMLKLGYVPTAITMSSVLVSCAQLESEDLGMQVHGLCVRYGFSSNVVVGTALLEMYSKSSNCVDLRKCFDEMPEKNVVTWTTLVSGYANNEKSYEAMMLAREMSRFGVKLNKYTYNSLLSSFSSPKDLVHGKQVHGLVIREGFESDNYLVVTLLTMYTDFGSLEDFRKLAQTISTSDQYSWNALIVGFSHLGNGQDAIDSFRRMWQEYIDIDAYTLTNLLKAIGMLSALKEGEQTHALAVKTGSDEDVYVQNGLVSMYARCGAIEKSKKVFFSIAEPDLVSWNSLLSGCAQHGRGQEVVELFEKMRTMGIKPNHSTFLSVLTACSHVGLLDHGIYYFNLMKYESIEPPRVEHYACVVDLLGRAGYLREAESFIDNMPIKPGPSVFKALLSACRVHGKVGIASRAAMRLFELCPNDPSVYVLQSSVYAEGGYWDDAEGMRKLMYARRVKKNPGYSWTDANTNYPIPIMENYSAMR